MGELSDEEDKEKYCVDIFCKGFEQDESLHSMPASPEHEDDGNDASVLRTTKAVELGRTAGSVDSNEHKRFVREIHEEANQAREKAYELKLCRQEQVAAHREKLKQAYHRKQIEKMKAASKTEQTNDGQ